MNWTPPVTEAAWQELLSAYLDGELDPEEASALGVYLATDPTRARQFDELRQLSRELQQWAAPEAAPEPEWLEVAGILSPGPRGWLRQAAVFLAGAAVGAALLHAIGSRTTDAILSQPGPVYPVTVSASISPGQATGILHEVDAEALRARLETHLRDGNWPAARETFETLCAEYPGSLALRELQTTRPARLVAALAQEERN